MRRYVEEFETAFKSDLEKSIMVNRISLTYLIFLFIALNACVKREIEPSMLINTSVSANVWLIPNESGDGRFYLQDVSDKMCYSIAAMDDGKAIIDTLSFSLHGYAFQYCVIGGDSVIAVSSDLADVQLVDFDGRRIKTIKNDIGVPAVTPNNWISMLDHRILLDNSNTMYSVTDSQERMRYYQSTAPALSVDICTGHSCQFGRFPEAYTKSNLNYWDYFPVICPNNQGVVALSFRRDHFISLYKNKNGEFLKSVPCKSRYIQNIDPYPDDKAFDLGYYKIYEFCQPRYSKLIFDDVNNLYYRIAIHEKSEPIGNRVDAKDCPSWSVMVLSDELKLLNEYLFYYKDYDPSVVFSSNGSLYVKKTPLKGSDSLVLAKFDFYTCAL